MWWSWIVFVAWLTGETFHYSQDISKILLFSFTMTTWIFGIQTFKDNDLVIIHEEKSERDKFAIFIIICPFLLIKCFIIKKSSQHIYRFFFLPIATVHWIDTSRNISDVTCNIIFHNAMREITVTSTLVLHIKHVFFLEPNNKISFVISKLMKWWKSWSWEKVNAVLEKWQL